VQIESPSSLSKGESVLEYVWSVQQMIKSSIP
jgi:hypothetical protein